MAGWRLLCFTHPLVFCKAWYAEVKLPSKLFLCKRWWNFFLILPSCWVLVQRWRIRYSRSISSKLIFKGRKALVYRDKALRCTYEINRLFGIKKNMARECLILSHIYPAHWREIACIWTHRAGCFCVLCQYHGNSLGGGCYTIIYRWNLELR